MAQKVTDDKRQSVFRLARLGCTVAEIAWVTGISAATIKRRFRRELDRGHAQLCTSIRRRQLAAARKGNITMLIWLGKQFLGQKDRQEVVHGETIEVVEAVVFPSDDTGDGPAYAGPA